MAVFCWFFFILLERKTIDQFFLNVREGKLVFLNKFYVEHLHKKNTIHVDVTLESIISYKISKIYTSNIEKMIF